MNYTYDLGQNAYSLLDKLIFFRYVLPWSIGIILSIVAVAGAFILWHKLTKPKPYTTKPPHPQNVSIIEVFLIAVLIVALAGAILN